MTRFVLAGVGVALVVVTLGDLFLTVFNYDGFATLANRYQQLLWWALRRCTNHLPERPRHAALSVGSAAMLPATVTLWLTLEITGFALVFASGFGHRSFFVTDHLRPGIGSAFYLSAGALTSLTFGDIVGRTGPYRSALVVETVIGLATFTIALGYVVTTFGVLDSLDSLHNTVRRHTGDPGRPWAVLERFLRNGDGADLAGLLQSLTDELDAYDAGLRRYPVVYYFHTRRTNRSIPSVFAALGELLAELRWGLPADNAVCDNPWLVALLTQYALTLDRLRRSFVGPDPFRPEEPIDRAGFEVKYAAGGGEDPSVRGFVALQERARRAARLALPPDGDLDAAYERYRQWEPFAHQFGVVLRRVAERLGYGDPLADLAVASDLGPVSPSH
jgi:hypothetical protein